MCLNEVEDKVAGIVSDMMNVPTRKVSYNYLPEFTPPDSKQAIRAKNIADIIVAKHRNGPLDEVSLFFQASQTRFRDLEVNQTIED